MMVPEHRAATHQRTLEMVFEHPMSHNIEWRNIVSLLESIGTVVEGTHDALHVTVNDETVVLRRPKHKDIPEEQLMQLRHFLRRAGVEPAAPRKEPNPE
jgi:hypothetical protein